MSRDPRAARVLGLWTAGWLAVFLVVGMVWLGEPTVQWPVLVVPLLWALVALRPRRRRAGAAREDDEHGGYWHDDEGRVEDEDDWPADQWADRWSDDPHDARRPPRVQPAERTDTVERPAVRRRDDDDRWNGRSRP